MRRSLLALLGALGGLMVNVSAPVAATQACVAMMQPISDQIERNEILPDGALITTYGPAHFINPYFGNLVALGLLQVPSGAAVSQNWMQWYLKHLNWPDSDGIYGTIYDYTLDAQNNEISQQRADSTDAYAGTFLTVARSLYETGNAAQRAYVASLKYQLDVVGGVIIKEQQPSGLTWAKPTYQVAYLLDNCEVYRGLADLAVLMNTAFHDPQAASYYSQRADLVKQGINAELWDASQNRYLVALFASGEKEKALAAKWYPDWYVQLFPVTQGVLSASDPRAVKLYGLLNQTFPNWSSPNGGVSGPSGAIGYAAALLGDTQRAQDMAAWLGSAKLQRLVALSGAIAEQSWFFRICHQLEIAPASKKK